MIILQAASPETLTELKVMNVILGVVCTALGCGMWWAIRKYIKDTADTNKEFKSEIKSIQSDFKQEIEKKDAEYTKQNERHADQIQGVLNYLTEEVVAVQKALNDVDKTTGELNVTMKGMQKFMENQNMIFADKIETLEKKVDAQMVENVSNSKAIAVIQEAIK